VTDLLTAYNDKPEVEKNVNIEALLEDTPKISHDNKPLFTFSTFINGVTANAQWCNSQIKVFWRWWGFQAHINQCNIDTINAGGTLFRGVYGLVLGLASAACAGVCHIIAFAVVANIALINWFNSRCGGNCVMLNRAWAGASWWWAVC